MLLDLDSIKRQKNYIFFYKKDLNKVTCIFTVCQTHLLVKAQLKCHANEMGCSASVNDSTKVIHAWSGPRAIHSRRQWPTPDRIISKMTPRSWTNINLSMIGGGGASVS